MAWLSPYLLADGQGTDPPEPMNYTLRQGESLTCHYQRQDRHHRGQSPIFSQIIGDCPLFEGRYANACVRWHPDLRCDLDEVGLACVGFERGSVGLVAATAQAAIRYRLNSPFPICGRYQGRDPAGKRMDGLLVRVNASASPAIAIRTFPDEDLVPVPTEQDSCEYFADLTQWVDLHQQYELAISLAKGQALRGIIIQTWCEVPLAALPAWYQPGREVRLAGRPLTDTHSGPLDLLLRWRHDGKLRVFRRRFAGSDIGKPFVPVPDLGTVQPVHMVLSICSDK